MRSLIDIENDFIKLKDDFNKLPKNKKFDNLNTREKLLCIIRIKRLNKKLFKLEKEYLKIKEEVI